MDVVAKENEREQKPWFRDLDVGEGRNWERSGLGCTALAWGERRRQWTSTLGLARVEGGGVHGY